MNIFKHLQLKKPNSFHYLFYLGVAFFIRFPFFFRDYIDRDESTFILIGKSITDGYLPYDFLWDLKPPLLFYVFAFVEWLFPHSLIAIRIFGLLIIFLSAIFLSQIAKTTGAKNSFLIGLTYIIASSLFGSVQGVMSEHVAVFFFLPALLLFLKNKIRFNLLFAGILFGCALLCKLNFAYTLLALFLSYFILYYRSAGLKEIVKKISITTFGLTLPFLVISIPYLVQNKLTLFKNSVFMATLEYGHTTKISGMQKLSVAAWIIFFGLLVSVSAFRFADKENKKQVSLIIAMLAGTIFTFYSSGTVNGHYLIGIYPFMAILFWGFIIKRPFELSYLKYAIIILIIAVESHIEYFNVFKHYSETSSLYNGSAFTAINELKKNSLDEKKIFFADHHIGYWFLNKYPLAKSVTHPSSLSRPEFFKHFGNTRTSMEELKYIMSEIKPEVIVSRKSILSFFSPNSPQNNYFDSVMKKDFISVYCNPEIRLFIFQRK